MNDFETPGELVRLYEARAKKRFGQHFLVDPSILEAIADEAGVESGDRVLEIGPGCGTLTLTLLERQARVRAVELDRDLAAFLREQLVPGRPFELIEGDFLEQDVEALLGEGETIWKCAANLPYNVATEIFFRLAPHLHRFDRLALMFQREVAERIVASAGDDDYSGLSLMCRLYADAHIVMHLPPGAFRPPPKVHSALVRFDPISGTRLPDAEVRRAFKILVRAAFQARRKTLPNALRSTGVPKDHLVSTIREVGLDPRIRPERVAFDQFAELASKLVEDV